MWIFRVIITSIIIWSAVVKFSKKKNKGKIITLMYAGTLSGFILTVSLFQRIRFKKTSAKQISYTSRKWMLRYKKKQRMQESRCFFLSLLA